MALPFVATGLFSFLGTSVSKLLSEGVVKYMAMKALLITLITVTVPIVAKNLIVWLYDTTMTAVFDNVDMTGIVAQTYEFTGFAGYIALEMQLPAAVSILLTAAGIRLVLNFIPFVG